MEAITTSLGNEPDSITPDDGDVDAAVEGTKITTQYQVPSLALATMEPTTTTALYSGDALTIWAGNQCWMSCDVGKALDPSIIQAQMILDAIYGMSAAAQGEITF